MSCPECAGRALVAPCPLCAEDDQAVEMEPIEAGRDARERCHARESNPWINPLHLTARALWFEGWDEADALGEEPENVTSHDAGDTNEPLDRHSFAKLALLLEGFSDVAQMQFAILKHELRGMTAMPPAMDRYVETLRQCHALQTQLKKIAA